MENRGSFHGGSRFSSMEVEAFMEVGGRFHGGNEFTSMEVMEVIYRHGNCWNLLWNYMETCTVVVGGGGSGSFHELPSTKASTHTFGKTSKSLHIPPKTSTHFQLIPEFP